MKNKKIKIISIILLLLALAAGGVFAYTQKQNDNNKPRPVNTVDYSGPTKQEAKVGDEQKEANKERQETDKAAPSTQANVVVVDGSQYGDIVEVRAYISNVYENGGGCTITFTEGSNQITKIVSAQKDATTTQCATLNVPKAEFNMTGEWEYTVTYESSTASGKSQPKSIRIQ